MLLWLQSEGNDRHLLALLKEKIKPDEANQFPRVGGHSGPNQRMTTKCFWKCPADKLSTKKQFA
jgi:hypothetical protein